MKEIICPFMGSWHSGQSSLELRFGQNAGYFASPPRNICTDEGEEMRHVSLINARRYTKIRRMAA